MSTCSKRPKQYNKPGSHVMQFQILYAYFITAKHVQKLFGWHLCDVYILNLISTSPMEYGDCIFYINICVLCVVVSFFVHM